MKKLSALFLALVLLLSAVPTAFAANTTPNTTTLTTTVPSATYVLNIPADQEIPFGQTSMGIGNVTITDSKSFAVGKNVEVTVVMNRSRQKIRESAQRFLINYRNGAAVELPNIRFFLGKRWSTKGKLMAR